MATEQIEPLPRVLTPAKTPAALQKKQAQQKKAEKAVKPKTKATRPKGRISTPERKPVRTEAAYVPREEVKKKKGSHPFVYLFFLLKCCIPTAD